MQGELRGGAGEEPCTQVAQYLALHGVLCDGGAVNVGSVRLLAYNQPLGMHDLEKLENRCVTVGALANQFIADLAHRCRRFLPEDSQKLELGFGRFRNGWS